MTSEDITFCKYTNEPNKMSTNNMKAKSNKKSGSKIFESYIKTSVIPDLKSEFPNIKLTLEESEDYGFGYSIGIRKVLVRDIAIYAGYYFHCFDDEDVRIVWDKPEISICVMGDILNPTNAWFTNIAKNGTDYLAEIKKFRNYFDSKYKKDVLLKLKAVHQEFYAETENMND